MSANYDPNLSTNLDWVRFLTGDTSAPFVLSDEEIMAVLLEETAAGTALKYFAAARVLGFIQARFSTMGRGLASKTVSRLSKSWGFSEGGAEVIDMRIRELRERGAQILEQGRGVLETLGSRDNDRYTVI